LKRQLRSFFQRQNIGGHFRDGTQTHGLGSVVRIPWIVWLLSTSGSLTCRNAHRLDDFFGGEIGDTRRCHYPAIG
jgi:hypothetical protein